MHNSKGPFVFLYRLSKGDAFDLNPKITAINFNDIKAIITKHTVWCLFLFINMKNSCEKS